MARWRPHGGQPTAHYYKCKICGSICFIFTLLNCPTCGAPFIKYDKHLKVMKMQLSFDELGVFSTKRKVHTKRRTIFKEASLPLLGTKSLDVTVIKGRV